MVVKSKKPAKPAKTARVASNGRVRVLTQINGDVKASLDKEAAVRRERKLTPFRKYEIIEVALTSWISRERKARKASKAAAAE